MRKRRRNAENENPDFDRRSPFDFLGAPKALSSGFDFSFHWSRKMSRLRPNSHHVFLPGVFLPRLICSTLLLSATLSTSACSLVAPTTTNLSIASDPSGAKVTVNGAYVGTTPTVYNTKRDQPIALIVSKDGYESATRSVSTKVSSTGIVDIIGGCIWLVPFFGLLAPGAWDLDSPNVTVQLAPKSGGGSRTRY